MPDDNCRNYYEIFVYSFCDSDGDGIGDLAGVTDKLDYITSLGCNGIWLTPVMPSTTYHKYDVKDYMDIDPEFGTLADFDALVSACHKAKVTLLVDMVINHSSAEHPWFVAACEYLRSLPEGAEPDSSVCPYVDYYHFSKEYPGNGWCNLSGTDYYYECQFWDQMPDLNLSNEALFSELCTVFDFWIERGVDGFRMDAPLHYEEGDTTFNADVLSRVYTYCNEKYKAMHSSSPRDFYMVSEVWASQATIAEYYDSHTPSFFNFDMADAEGKIIKAARGTTSAASFVSAMESYEEEFAGHNPDYIDASFIANHDMGRVGNALMSDPNAMKMAGGLLSIMKGSTFVYYGEEIGMKSKGQKDENKRLPMQWGDGMTKGPADADAGIEQVFGTVLMQQNDPDSILAYYKKAFALRNKYPEVARGTTSVCAELTDENIAVFSRVWGDNSVCIVINNGSEASEVDLSLTGVSQGVQIETLSVSNEVLCKFEGGKLTIPPQSIVYVK